MIESSGDRRAEVARALAHSVLENVGTRWQHTCGVAERAEQLAVTVPAEEAQLLVTVAWLHDIGYGPASRRSGFHPLDGADLLTRQGWPQRIAGLVAHHSGARYLAAEIGLLAELERYPMEESALSDALTYADQTVGPAGEPMSIEERFAEMLARHGPDSIQAKVHPRRAPFLLAVAARVEERLAR